MANALIWPCMLRIQVTITSGLTIANIQYENIQCSIRKIKMNVKISKNVFLEQVREIQKHRLLESEKAGYDVGEEWAAVDWISKYAASFRGSLRKRFKN